MNWESIINSTTALVVALTAFVVAVSGLVAAFTKARDTINLSCYLQTYKTERER